ncbi:MAG TPA: DUF6320 domain-containing protein [Phycisphaerales bacterium]|nr:DUF6320 domain-containing protein [Phycisphaerales bacterium]
MPYCSRCGVEVVSGAETCPLCNAPIQRLDAGPPEPPRYPDVAPSEERQMRRLVWMIATAALLSVALTLVGLDIVLTGRISWSLYPLTGAAVLWLFTTLVVIFARRPIFVIAGQAVATAGFLLAIDAFDGDLDWLVPLGLPIVAIVTGASVLVWLVARFSRRDPASISASVLFACAASAVALDLLISKHLGAPRLSWSFIVLGAALPPLALLLYFRLRLRRRIHLRRVLHT